MVLENRRYTGVGRCGHIRIGIPINENNAKTSALYN